MKKKILIFHITHIENLDSILRCQGIFCKNRQPEGCRNIAYESIQERRASTVVPLFPYGILQDYVPFYFAPRSPMLYTLHKGNVAGFAEDQGRIIHIVSSVETVEKTGLAYVFTDGHPIMGLSEFYADPSDFDKIDWEIMNTDYWADIPEDGDRKRRRQAEFLIHQFFPVGAILGIGVFDQNIRNETAAIVARNGMEIRVEIRRNWYY
jgi:hypothetical protein